MTTDSVDRPSFKYALLMLLSVVALISIGLMVFDAPIQILMFMGIFVLIPMMMRLGYTYSQVNTILLKSMSDALPSVLILLNVGILIGTWMASGTVPTLIYYGINLISPQFFLLTTLLFTSVVALTTGTSWGAIGTAGVAMMGVGGTLGIPAGITAGAIISGAYFGDKMSPLSDTTNLAPAVAGGTLLSHIRHMLWTTVPAYLISALLYTFIGLQYDVQRVDSEMVNGLMAYLTDTFQIGFLPLLPIAVLIALMMMKKPAVVAIFLASITGGAIAVFHQGFSVSQTIETMYNGYQVDSGIAFVNELLQRGGLMSMLPLIALFLFALGLGGMLSDSGVLEALLQPVANKINHTGTLILVTMLVAYATLAIGGAIYFSTVMTGTLMKPLFDKMNLKPENLSRTLEDTATQAGALVPWTGAGIYAVTTLGVPVSAFLPFTFLAYITPVFSLFYGITGISMTRKEDSTLKESVANSDVTTD